MQVIVGKSNLKALGRFETLASMLASPRAKQELQRGVTDAGRKVKTRVQKAVKNQMGLLPGNYVSYVVAGTRGIPRPGILAFDIFGVKGGTDIEEYRGLRAVKRSSGLNKGRRGLDRGEVRSGVWNNPRVFKRSFATNSGFYAMRTPEAGVKAPRILWTHDDRSWQPRGARGRFASTSSTPKWGKVRKLYGPSLMKEIPEDQSLFVFMTQGPVLLEQAVMKRVTKLMRF